MMNDIFLAIVFAMNIGLMAYISYDVLKKKQKTVDTANDNEPNADAAKPPFDSQPTKKAGIGKSKFSMDEVRMIAQRAAETALADAVAGEIELDEVRFDDEDDTRLQNNATLDPDAVKIAFETDVRIDAEVAESNGVSEPMASGSTFDELARAELILGRKTEPTTEEHQYVVRVFADFKDTQLMDHIPKYILDKLNECHRKVEAMNEPKLSENKSEPVKVKNYEEFLLDDFLPSYHKQ